jgi:hypothetical protein
MGFLEDLAKQQGSPQPTADAVVQIGDSSYTFRFTRMRGIQWAVEAVKHPARPGVLLDARYGYNLHDMVRAVAPLTGARVDGDDLVQVETKQWKALFESLDAAGVQEIVDTVWALNEWNPQQELEAAKKALRESPTDSDSLSS